MVSADDVVIAISYSGESNEITGILSNIKIIGAKLIGITGNADSTLAKMSDIVQVLPQFEEACHMGLAPTSSTTVTLVYGDALAVLASEIYGFNKSNFGLFHPAGALGKKLILKVDDLMKDYENSGHIMQDADMYEAVMELGSKGDICVLLDQGKKVQGVITDGDLRRAILKKMDIYNLKADEIASKHPTLIKSGAFAVEALKLMREKNITCAPVVDEENNYCGVITIKAILDAGIVS